MTDSAKPAATGQRLSAFAKFSYALIPLSYTMSTMVATWQMLYYTSYLAISIAVVTAILAFGKWAGAFISPVWGYLSDRMYSTAIGRKFGRRRAMLLMLAPLNLVFYVLLWIPNMPIWAYVVVNVLYFGTWPGVTTINYALPAEMTDNSKDRAQLVALGQIGGAVGGFTLSMLNAYLFQVWGSKEQSTYFNIAMIYAVAGTIFLIVAALAIKERPYDESTNVGAADGAKGKVSPIKRLVSVFWNFASVMRIRTFRNYLWIYLTQIAFRNVRGLINSYFIIFVLLLNPQTVSVSTGISFVFGIVCVMFWGWLITRLGGVKTYRMGGWVTIVIMIAIGATALFKNELGTTNTAIVFTVLITLFGLGNSGIVNAQQYISAFVPDVDEVVTGKRREGQYAGINSTVSTLMQAILTMLIGVVLQAAGFQSGAETQPDSAVNVLLWMYVLTPIVMCLLGNWLTYRMGLNDETHKALRAEADRLKNGGSMDDVDPKTREIVEKMSGMKYEQCWGHNNIIDATRKD